VKNFARWVLGEFGIGDGRAVVRLALRSLAVFPTAQDDRSFGWRRPRSVVAGTRLELCVGWLGVEGIGVSSG
jgi:hypothetical protein